MIVTIKVLIIALLLLLIRINYIWQRIMKTILLATTTNKISKIHDYDTTKSNIIVKIISDSTL